MRAGFGLVGLLITIGVIVWFMYKIELPHDQAVISAGQKATEQVNQISGNATDGSMRFEDSLDLEVQNSGGHPNSLLVTNVVPTGPAATYFGLKRGDVIIAIETHANRERVRDINDAGLAKARLIEAYSYKGFVVVSRDEQEVVLPLPTMPAAPAATPAAAPTQKKSGDEIQGQIDAIKGIGR